MNMAHSMVSHKKLSDEYWPEAIGCSVYLLDRSPTVTLQEKILVEAWSGTKTSVSHLRIFGSIAFAHIPHEVRRKLKTRKVSTAFSLVIVNNTRHTSCIIVSPKILW